MEGLSNLFGAVGRGLIGGMQNVGTDGQYVRDLMAQEQAQRIRQAQQAEQAQQMQQAQGMANLFGIEDANGLFSSPAQVMDYMRIQQGANEFDRNMALQNRQQDFRENQFAYNQNMDLQRQNQALPQNNKERQEFIRGLPQIRNAYETSLSQLDSQYETLGELIDDAGLTTTGRITDFIKTPAAKNFEVKLRTVLAQEAFGTLQALRDASKTGGALGQVSEKELKLLEAARVALDQAQTPKAFKAAARKLQQRIKSSKNLLQQAYRYEIGRQGLRESDVNNIMEMYSRGDFNPMMQPRGQQGGQGQGGVAKRRRWDLSTNTFN